MALSLIILGALCFTCIVMAGALWLAWAGFGRPRHAASWAIAFAVSAAQALLNAITLATGSEQSLLAISFLLLIFPGPLVAIGVRQRAGRPSRWRWMLGAIAVEATFLGIAAAVPRFEDIGFASAPVFAACFLVAGAWMLRRRDRPLLPAERVMMIALAMMGAAEFAAAIPTALSGIWSQELPGMRVYRAILVLGIPPSVVCGGVAAILLVASDLAVDLRRLASRDPLTGLLNRRGFQEAAIRVLANARRMHVPITIVLADIDHFKTINDRFGHTAGDRVLCFLGERLTGGVRQGDLVARIGGEEFAIMLIADAPEEAGEAIERIRRAVEQGYVYEGAQVPVTASFGIAQVPIATGDLDAIIARALDRADRALYLSKMQGRNRVTIDTPTLSPSA